MRMTWLAGVLALGVVAGAACKKEEAAPEATDKPATETKAEPTEPPPEEKKAPEEKPPEEPGEEPDGMANKMKHCPNAVPGAKTEVATEGNQVVVTITVDEHKAAEVVERVKHLAELQIKEPEEVEHSGKGTGGGRGKCPIVSSLSKIAKHEAKGGVVKIYLEPLRADELQKVADQVKERTQLLASAEPVHEHGSGAGGGTGGGGGKAGGDKDGAKSGGDEAKAGGAKASGGKKSKPKEEEGGW